jgi:hypothetical protein
MARRWHPWQAGRERIIVSIEAMADKLKVPDEYYAPFCAKMLVRLVGMPELKKADHLKAKAKRK